MSENEESAEARRWLRYALEDLEAGEALPVSERLFLAIFVGWLSNQRKKRSRQR